jgi:hypothetical protein
VISIITADNSATAHNQWPFYGYQEGLHNFTQAHPNCFNETHDGKGHSIEKFVQTRADLRVSDDQMAFPTCMCCNNQKPRAFGANNSCTKPKQPDVKEWACPHAGTCCDRSTVLDPNEQLREDCAVCNVYNPCDQKRCAARPDNIRNTQHTPMIIGIVLSLISNFYVVYTYTFDDKLREATVTKLLVWAAAVEVLFCVCFVLQELSFRVPDDICLGDDCVETSTWHAWPTWDKVARSYYQAYEVKSGEVKSGEEPPWKTTAPPGQRGSAINWCEQMSFLYQLTWTASDTFYFMISVDLLLNLYASPFGSTKKRIFWYHIITWALAIGFAITLVASGDWGVSHESLLEDFCWNVNFGRENHRDHSRLPNFMRVVYGLSITYYVISLGIVCLAKWKVSSLTMGQQQARGKTINEGMLVVFVSSAWLGVWAMLYFFIVLPTTHNIVKSLNVYPNRYTTGDFSRPRFPTDYSQQEGLVSFWAFAVGARNVINFIIWRFVVIPRLNKDYKARWTEQIVGRLAGKNVEAEDSRELQKVLQQELLFFTGLGIRGACRLAVDSSGSQPVNRVSQPRTSPTEGQNSAEIDHGPQEVEVDLPTANSKEESLGEGGTPSAFYSKFNNLFVTTEQATELETQRRLQADAQIQEEKERNEHLAQYKFRTYCPNRFRELRKLFRIDEGDMAGGLHDAMEAYQEGSFTGGASGSFMYYSQDKRFIVKQITHAELKVLLDILPQYHDHLKKSVDLNVDSPTFNQCKSLMLRIVHCSRIKMYHSTSKILGKCLQVTEAHTWFHLL